MTLSRRLTAQSTVASLLHTETAARASSPRPLGPRSRQSAGIASGCCPLAVLSLTAPARNRPIPGSSYPCRRRLLPPAEAASHPPEPCPVPPPIDRRS